ncbi:unnamed protein product [Penicillium nalgiovense]|nr:unnamed protein product [Penicillium nalgiovense]
MSYSQASRSQYEASQHANSFIDSDLPQSDESLDALSSQSIAQSTPVSDTPLPLNILVPPTYYSASANSFNHLIFSTTATKPIQ